MELTQHQALVTQLAILAVVLPFVAFLVNYLFVPKQSKLSGGVSAVAILLTFALSAYVFFQIWDQSPIHVRHLWFSIGDSQVYVGVWLNNLSVLMLLLVSAIALPVHIYSMAYMDGDERYSTYFAYLSFFCFAMLALVIMDNLLLLYAFWELVGFASYLLIGFWFTREKAVQANKKAFIMNRIGDVGLLIGILIIYSHYHTFDMVTLFDGGNPLVAGASIGTPWITLAGLCLLCGAIAKSAQFPLHTWLPDAMEGPTSVSALIHAATMVAAGIFLLGRVYPVFNQHVLIIIAIIGCFTAFMAATIALTQTDLKRILAYSTISQLGFMMLGMGVGAYSSSLFHLATHAFFKCLLFLGAGVIIHQMNHLKHEHHLDIDPQNILHMGGLRKLMPVTFITCCIASLALIGFPLTSGYLSKDGILIQSFNWAQDKGWAYYIIPIGAMLTSLLTTFYIARLIFKVFFGESRLKQIDPEIEPKAHEGNWLLSVPMMLLAACSLFPLFSFNPFGLKQAWLLHGFAATAEAENSFRLWVPVMINVAGLAIIYMAYLIYAKQSIHWFKQKGVLFNLSYNQWYIDSFYNQVIVKLVLGLGKTLYWFDKHVLDGFINLLAATGILLGKISALFDQYIIDGLLHLIAYVVKQTGNFIRGFQTGRVQNYLLTMLLIILVVYVLKTFI
ncbi:proton-translocating NADH-quinone oxidoreductase chain L [Mucilaginibacter gracilis]|uniref:Proton-translocating NADH-quinone oxidoreductase chain L n=1 Tax=Mucilaginibacter gracilis TaxID=423350 RepID=A0A495J0U4_9SPHI|nr:NADH-quinone oxidoreductase subunit L [Mucilaginibacter gracilis]RKR82567.1 proton-translocating NADH-quinone oxidoreductase chain L [Mucilaginibacter gracilis]